MRKDRFDSGKSKAAAAVMAILLRQCDICKVSSSKQKLYGSAGGPLLCGACLNATGVSPAEMERHSEQEVERLKIESKKPKPEGYGGWS